MIFAIIFLRQFCLNLFFLLILHRQYYDCYECGEKSGSVMVRVSVRFEFMMRVKAINFLIIFKEK
jgi:hypothetical protein